VYADDAEDSAAANSSPAVLDRLTFVVQRPSKSESAPSSAGYPVETQAFSPPDAPASLTLFDALFTAELA
jgi:hypothetical protein